MIRLWRGNKQTTERVNQLVLKFPRWTRSAFNAIRKESSTRIFFSLFLAHCTQNPTFTAHLKFLCCLGKMVNPFFPRLSSFLWKKTCISCSDTITKRSHSDRRGWVRLCLRKLFGAHRKLTPKLLGLLAVPHRRGATIWSTAFVFEFKFPKY